MGERALALFFLFILSVDLAYAGYTCSAGAVVVDRKEIKEFRVRNVNGLSVGIGSAYESRAIGRVGAEFVVDADFIALSNETGLSGNITLSDGKHTITLVNASDDFAVVSVDGTQGFVEESRSATIKGLLVFLGLADNEMGVESIEVVVGKSTFFLFSDSKRQEKRTVEGVVYGIELISASDTSAIVDVSKCLNGSLVDIVVPETQDANLTVENTTLQGNESLNESIDNESLGDGSDEENESVIENESIGGSLGADDARQSEGFLGLNIYYLVGGGVILVALIVFLILTFLSRRRERTSERIGLPEVKLTYEE